MSASHTPGPWIVQKEDVSIYAGSIRVADVRGWGGLQYKPDGAEEMDANARLIAAAPDLLGALCWAIRAHEQAVEGHAPTDAGYADWFRKALALVDRVAHPEAS